jgi:LacI family transcriptional regulator
MSKQSAKVRITDIAKRARVSPGTVDRVIHDRGEVSPKTRERVLNIIKELNYEPDFFASTLASKKTYSFASLIPDASGENEFWNIPALGLQKALNQVSHFSITHNTFTFNYFNRESFKLAAKELLEGKPDGVIIAPVFADLAEIIISKCIQNNIPVVLINANIFNLEKLTFVGQDSFRSGMVSARLLDYGLKPDHHIYIINIMSEKGTNAHLLSREEGFRSYFREIPSKRNKLHTINICGNDLQKVYEVLSHRLINNKKRTSGGGIFVTNSRVYLVAEFLKSMHVKNYRLVGYDLLDINISHLQEGTIDFLISQKPFEQGFKSFMSLFDHLVMKKNIPTYQYLPIDIITRENIDYYVTHQ